MSSIAMEICPLCAACPRLAGRWRVQVRCSCGACGPRTKTEKEAIGRWNSVVSFVRELGPAGVVDTGERARTRRPPGARRLVRQLAWPCGLELHGGF